MSNSGLLIKRSEAARLLGVSEQTITNYVERGLIVEAKYDGRVMHLQRNSVMAIANSYLDVGEQEEKLRQLGEELEKAKAEREERIELMRNEPWMFFNGKRLSDALLRACDCIGRIFLSDREHDILMSYARGSDLPSVKYGIGEARCRQIAAHALHKIETAGHVEEIYRENARLRKIVEGNFSLMEEKRRGEAASILDENIFSVLFLSQRIENILRHMEIDSLRQLVKVTKRELKKTKNCGSVSVAAIEAMLESVHLHLGMSEYDIDRWERNYKSKDENRETSNLQ